ncbi:MAG TPA: flagellar FliJ family protein [Opitutus sp.]|nr:flagellar FliJ family protein [Opitutus sp.]
MKRYHFPLRAIGVLRAHRELRAREAFAVAVRAHASAEENLAAARDRRAALALALAAGREGTFAAAEAAACFRAYGRECEAEQAAARATVAAQAELHARREQYLAARRRLEAINKLEEKSRAAHRRELERHEQRELDEFARHHFLQARDAAVR